MAEPEYAWDELEGPPDGLRGLATPVECGRQLKNRDGYVVAFFTARGEVYARFYRHEPFRVRWFHVRRSDTA